MITLAADDQGISYPMILMGLFGGLALFLFGMEQMTGALKKAAGRSLSDVLGKLTTNRFSAAFTGAFVTAVIQSSSVTTVLVVGFISAGLMSLQQSIGVIIGANVGSTITAQIVAFKVTEYALAIVAIGFVPMFFSKRSRWQQYGSMVMGLGMIFLGMGVMSEATTPLRTFEPFIDLMKRMDNAFFGIFVGAVFTALVQSSSATTGIVIVLASQGFISLEAGIALAFGANIGTCVTAGLASLGKPIEAKQAAAVHLLFNVLGILVWLPLIGVLASFVRDISPVHEQLQGAQRIAAETPRQIANAHTAFNVANTLAFIWFTGPLANLVTRILPKKPEPQVKDATPQYLQEAYLQTPSIAIERVRLEVQRFGEHVGKFSEKMTWAIMAGEADDIDAVVDRAINNQSLYDQINGYIRRLSIGALSATENNRLATLSSISNHIQSVNETVAVNFVSMGRERVTQGVRFSEETIQHMLVFNAQIREAFDAAVASLEMPELAEKVVSMKQQIRQAARKVSRHLATRLAADDPHRTLLYRLETQAVESSHRVYYLARKIAKEVLRVSKESDDSSQELAEAIAETQ